MKVNLGIADIYNLKVDEEIQIEKDRLKIIDIKAGGLGRVFFLRREGNILNHSILKRRKFALKIAKETENNNLIIQEVKKWKDLEHENIVPLASIIHFRDEGVGALMPLFKGTLDELLKKNSDIEKEKKELIYLKYILQLLEGLIYAYEKAGIHHLDLKPMNILYDKTTLSTNPKICIADWGISSSRIKSYDNELLCTTGANTNNNLGTIPYMAPERFIKDYPSSEASDIFSIGIILYEMIARSLPYKNRGKIIEELISYKYFINLNEELKEMHVSPFIKTLILYLTHPVLGERAKTLTSVYDAIFKESKTREALEDNRDHSECLTLDPKEKTPKRPLWRGVLALEECKPLADHIIKWKRDHIDDIIEKYFLTGNYFHYENWIDNPFGPTLKQDMVNGIIRFIERKKLQYESTSDMSFSLSEELARLTGCIDRLKAIMNIKPVSFERIINVLVERYIIQNLYDIQNEHNLQKYLFGKFSFSDYLSLMSVGIGGEPDDFVVDIRQGVVEGLKKWIAIRFCDPDKPDARNIWLIYEYTSMQERIFHPKCFYLDFERNSHNEVYFIGSSLNKSFTSNFMNSQRAFSDPIFI